MMQQVAQHFIKTKLILSVSMLNKYTLLIAVESTKFTLRLSSAARGCCSCISACSVPWATRFFP